MDAFEKWDSEFRKQNLFAFNGDGTALLWLKVRAVCRAKLIEKFLSQNKIVLKSKKVSEQNKELFETLCEKPRAMKILDCFLTNESNELYRAMGVDEIRLKDDLYKVQSYAWGGDQNNSLDKFLVRRYVKEIPCYDELNAKKDEIANNAWNYVQTSWFNNWTSYLIESLFKTNEKVVSAVGEIKSVDFFIKDIPVDLKVTFFPNQFMNEKFKEKEGAYEIAWLKKKAKEFNISFDNTATDSQLKYALLEKFKDCGKKSVVEQFHNVRKQIVCECVEEPVNLMRWLYENQGEMRFGAENRLFLILVDLSDIDQSWKMKRNFMKIEPAVKSYLDGFRKSFFKEIDFSFNKTTYKTLADVLFVFNE